MPNCQVAGSVPVSPFLDSRSCCNAASCDHASGSVPAVRSWLCWHAQSLAAYCPACCNLLPVHPQPRAAQAPPQQPDAHMPRHGQASPKVKGQAGGTPLILLSFNASTSSLRMAAHSGGSVPARSNQWAGCCVNHVSQHVKHCHAGVPCGITQARMK